MMKNKFYFAMAAAGMMMSYGCSESEPGSEQEHVPFSFTISVDETRSLLEDDTYALEGFWIYAQVVGAEDALFEAVAYSQENEEGTKEWIIDCDGEDPEWPSNRNSEVEFLAFGAGSEKESFYPDCVETSESVVMNQWIIDCRGGKDYVAVGKKMKYSDRVDGKVPLVFQHIMSKVLFEIKASDPTYNYVLKSISMTGPYEGVFDARSLYDGNVTSWTISQGDSTIFMIYDDEDKVIEGQDYTTLFAPIPGQELEEGESPIEKAVCAYLLPTEYNLTVKFAYYATPEGDDNPLYNELTRTAKVTLPAGKSTVIRLGLVSDALNIGGDNGTGDSAD